MAAISIPKVTNTPTLGVALQEKIIPQKAYLHTAFIAKINEELIGVCKKTADITPPKKPSYGHASCISRVLLYILEAVLASQDIQQAESGLGLKVTGIQGDISNQENAELAAIKYPDPKAEKYKNNHDLFTADAQKATLKFNRLESKFRSLLTRIGVPSDQIQGFLRNFEQMVKFILDQAGLTLGILNLVSSLISST